MIKGTFYNEKELEVINNCITNLYDIAHKHWEIEDEIMNELGMLNAVLFDGDFSKYNSLN